MDSEEPQCQFLDLPTELRDRIYQFCFNPQSSMSSQSCISSQHPPSWARPIEPPITFASRRIRTESLPLFYTNYTPVIQTYVKSDMFDSVRLMTKKWLDGLASEKLRHIENFRLRFILIQRYSGEFVPIEFQVSLAKRNHSYSLSHSFDIAWMRNPHRIGDPADFEEVLSVLRTHLTQTLDRLLKDPGIRSWAVEDVYHLMQVDPESLPLQTIKR